MKYQTERHPNPDCLTIHTDVEVVHGKSFQTFESPESFGPGWTEKEMPVLASELFAVPGITKVSFSRYTVHLIKGKVFNWDEMLESINPILKNHLSPEDEMVEWYDRVSPCAHSVNLDAMEDAFDLPEDGVLGDLRPADLVGTEDTETAAELGTDEDAVVETAPSEDSEADANKA